MMGAVSPDSFDTLHSYSNTFQMPFVTPWFPEKVSYSVISHPILSSRYKSLLTNAKTANQPLQLLLFFFLMRESKRNLLLLLTQFAGFDAIIRLSRFRHQYATPISSSNYRYDSLVWMG